MSWEIIKLQSRSPRRRENPFCTLRRVVKTAKDEGRVVCMKVKIPHVFHKDFVIINMYITEF